VECGKGEMVREDRDFAVKKRVSEGRAGEREKRGVPCNDCPDEVEQIEGTLLLGRAQKRKRADQDGLVKGSSKKEESCHRLERLKTNSGVRNRRRM